MRDTLSDVNADLDELIAERDNIRTKIEERARALMDGPEFDNDVQALKSGASIEVDGIIMTSLSDYLDYIDMLAINSVLSGPARADYSKLLERIGTQRKMREELRGAKITPVASGI
jgi:uncharacterized protein YeeX (DUF496 family)